MKSQDPNNIDPLLREWRVANELPSGFKAGVWSRIAAQQQRLGLAERLLGWLDEILPRPAPAFAYLTVLLMVGLGAGHWAGQTHARQTENQLLVEYVQSVDPYKSLE